MCPGAPLVTPTKVFEGLICAIPARFRIGIVTLETYELNSPM